MAVDLQVLRPGDTLKPDPYTVAFVANPFLEAPWNSGTLKADPMPANKGDFDATVGHAVDCLFGLLPAQAETLMADRSIEPNVRVVSLRVTGLPATDANALVGESVFGHLLAPRRNQMTAFVAGFEINADVICAVSDSSTYSRESAYGTTDDPTRPGTPFTLNGLSNMHWHYAQIPGTVVLHRTTRSLTPLHEFGHAASSYTSGYLTDLYVDNQKAHLNCGIGRPIPALFGNYNGTACATDPSRDGLGYPPSWLSYHCALVATAVPSMMDNYPAAVNPLDCRFDEISAAYMFDRLRAKVGR